MKYILKKDLPLAKAGTKVFVKVDNSPIATMYSAISTLWEIRKADIPEWLEEVKEPKTIYDLKKGDEYWTLNEYWEIKKRTVVSWVWTDNAHNVCFLTEREAKRNKLLRELATREKFLPERWDYYINFGWNENEWECNDMYRTIMYNMGLIFRNREEYDKWMTDEAKDLLFNL